MFKVCLNVQGPHLAGRKYSNLCHRRRPRLPLLPLPPLLDLLAISRPKASPPFPLLANLTALWIFSSVSSARGSFPIFLWSLPNFANRLRDAFFSCSTDTSVGSNCDNLNEYFFLNKCFPLDAYLAFDTMNILFAIQPLVKLAHTSSTYFCSCQGLFNLHFSFLARNASRTNTVRYSQSVVKDCIDDTNRPNTVRYLVITNKSK